MSFSKDIKKGTVAELRLLMNKVPTEYDNLSVWLGADTGEGYISLRTIMVANAFFCDLDGDEACGKAYSYFNDDPEELTVEKSEIPQEYTFLQENPDGVIEAYKDIFLLGDNHCKNDIKNQQKAHNQLSKRNERIAQLVKERDADPDYKEFLELQNKMKNKYKDVLNIDDNI